MREVLLGPTMRSVRVLFDLLRCVLECFDDGRATKSATNQKRSDISDRVMNSCISKSSTIYIATNAVLDNKAIFLVFKVVRH